MGQPGMRVTVDAAMRARDVSRPGVEPAPEDTSAAKPDAPRKVSGTDAVPHENGERGDLESRPQRRNKAERRRLSKRHARR